MVLQCTDGISALVVFAKRAATASPKERWPVLCHWSVQLDVLPPQQPSKSTSLLQAAVFQSKKHQLASGSFIPGEAREQTKTGGVVGLLIEFSWKESKGILQLRTLYLLWNRQPSFPGNRALSCSLIVKGFLHLPEEPWKSATPVTCVSLSPANPPELPACRAGVTCRLLPVQIPGRSHGNPQPANGEVLKGDAWSSAILAKPGVFNKRCPEKSRRYKGIEQNCNTSICSSNSFAVSHWPCT